MKTKNLSKIEMQKIKKNITQIKDCLDKSPNYKEILDKVMEIDVYLQKMHFGLNFESHIEEIEEIIKKHNIEFFEVKNLSIYGNNLEVISLQ